MVAHVEADDRRVQFVGIETYTKAGGQIVRDLFDDEHQGYLTDAGLLDRLVIEKLESAAEAVRAEGWKWVTIMPDVNREHLRGLGRIYPEREPPTEEQQAEIERLTAQYDALAEEHGDEPPDDIPAEIAELGDKVDTLSEGTERWLPEDIALAGAVVGIGYDGRLIVERGYVRPEDEPADTGSRETGTAKAKRGAGTPGLSDRLAENLTAHRTAALRSVLARSPDVALAAVVHALALPMFFRHEAESCLALKLDSAALHSSAEGIEDSAAAVAMVGRREFWLLHLPERAEALWDWLLAQDTATRLDLLAYCAGCSVNAVKKRHEPDGDRLHHAGQLAAALSLDMAQWWQPMSANE